MSGARAIRIFPDADRVEAALVEAASTGGGFVDASGYLSFTQLVERCDPARELGRQPATPLTARVVLWSAARQLPAGPFKAFVHEPAFAPEQRDLEKIVVMRTHPIGIAGHRLFVGHRDEALGAQRIPRARIHADRGNGAAVHRDGTAE